MLGLPADGKREERAMANVITCPISCRASAAAAAGAERIVFSRVKRVEL